MTANALQGDRELCAAAGMDDYVAKPIRVEELVAAIERCQQRPEARTLGGVATGVTEMEAPRSSPSGTERRGVALPSASLVGASTVQVIDRTTFDRLAATMGGAFVTELIATFGEDARELIGTLRRALAETDIDAFRRAAHSLKSTGETVGATGLAGLARELESMARAGRLDGASGRLEQLVGMYEIVARSLEELRRGLPA